MPADASRFLHCALIHLAVGATMGMLALAYKAAPTVPLFWRLMPAHRELLLYGWLLQLAFGVSCWIFPRFLDPTKRSPDTARVSFWLLNIGILLSAMGPLLSLGFGVYIVGKLLEILGCGAFLLHAWPRIRPPRLGRCG